MCRPSLRVAFIALSLIFFARVTGFGQNPLFPGEPIVVNYAHAYPTTVSPPGSLFLPVAYNTSSILGQLAHSLTGVVQLPPGDYSIPVRIYCTNVHAPTTQHGLAYRMAPLEGKRAPLLIALASRAAAAHVPFQPLQQLIWQIMGGLSYSQMPPPSQELVDQLIPEFRSKLDEDFVTALQKRLDLLKRFQPTAVLANDLETLIQRYQQIQRTLIQDANNFEALEHQMVNILPGTAENAGPSSWSRVSDRVYTRLTDGNVYGELGHLQIRVLPSRLATRPSNALVTDASFHPGAPIPTLIAETDSVDVPIESSLAYPNAQTMQALLGIAEILVCGDKGPACQTKLVLELSVLNLELQPIETGLMWITCTATSPNVNPPSAADIVVTLVSKEPALGTTGQLEIDEAARIAGIEDDLFQFIAGDPTGVVADLMQHAQFNCGSYDATNAIKKAAQDHVNSLGASLKRTTMRVIQNTKGSFMLETTNGDRRIQVRLALVPCSQDVYCSESLIQ